MRQIVRMQRVYFPEPEFEYSGLIRVTPQHLPMHGLWWVCTYYDIGVLHGLILNIQTQAPGNKPAASELFVSFGLGNVSLMLY